MSSKNSSSKPPQRMPALVLVVREKTTINGKPVTILKLERDVDYRRTPRIYY